MDRRIRETIDSIGFLDVPAMNWARRRQELLTKPPGSLGRLEDLAIRITGITSKIPPKINDKVILTVAADHGVTMEGVSAYPQEVTAQMVLNFLGGGAAINVLAKGAGARVVVVDAGVAAELPSHPELVSRRVGPGTANFAQGPAMSRMEAETAIVHGIEIAQEQIALGADLIGVGDMGIGNTTASSAITSVLTGRPVADVTGRGTGITADQLRHKVGIIEQAIALNRPDPADPIDVLMKVGGFEIGVMAGAMLGGAAGRTPIVLDGFISGAAALIAASLSYELVRYLFAAHTSVEIGHRAILERLELVPILNLDLRLGEGTGAALAFGLIDQAVNVLNGMATFSEAGISGRSAPVEQALRFPNRRLGYYHALEGGIWDDPFLHADGNHYRHIVSTDLERLASWAESRGLPRSRITRRDLKDFRANRERVAAWHIDLGGPYLDLE
jgi:nicotinate-nucleotide--dimethylbenzimidazole phosphoribosyltransferase